MSAGSNPCDRSGNVSFAIGSFVVAWCSIAIRGSAGLGLGSSTIGLSSFSLAGLTLAGLGLTGFTVAVAALFLDTTLACACVRVRAVVRTLERDACLFRDAVEVRLLATPFVTPVFERATCLLAVAADPLLCPARVRGCKFESAVWGSCAPANAAPIDSAKAATLSEIHRFFIFTPPNE